MYSGSILKKTIIDKGEHKSKHPGIGNSQEARKSGVSRNQRTTGYTKTGNEMTFIINIALIFILR